jgi:hypothetical protein
MEELGILVGKPSGLEKIKIDDRGDTKLEM